MNYSPDGASIHIAGVGMHPFGKFPDLSLRDMARVAISRALGDAALGPRDIDAVYASNALGGRLQGQEMVRGQTILREVGIEGIPVVNVENACAGGSTALREAASALKAGNATYVLAVGFEKMFVGDRATTLEALRSASDVEVVEGMGIQYTAVYAMRLQQMMSEGRLTTDDLVASAVKSHENGALNPYAQYRKPVTPEEVLESPRIADPLTLLMCSSFSDGAAAVVLTLGPPASRDAGRPQVVIRGSSMRTGRTWEPGLEPVATVAAKGAFEAAGVGPDDIGVWEVHDAMAPAELMYYEQLGLCQAGDEAKLLSSGRTSLTGDMPVNPSGGLSSRGHPVGATGLAQIAELVWQLRGEAGPRQVRPATLGLAQNSGGWLEGESAVCNVHILERVGS